MNMPVEEAVRVSNAVGRNLDPDLCVTVRRGFAAEVWVVSVTCSQHYSAYECQGDLRAYGFAAQLIEEVNAQRRAAGVPEIGICS